MSRFRCTGRRAAARRLASPVAPALAIIMTRMLDCPKIFRGSGWMAHYGSTDGHQDTPGYLSPGQRPSFDASTLRPLTRKRGPLAAGRAGLGPGPGAAGVTTMTRRLVGATDWAQTPSQSQLANDSVNPWAGLSQHFSMDHRETQAEKHPAPASAASESRSVLTLAETPLCVAELEFEKISIWCINFQLF